MLKVIKVKIKKNRNIELKVRIMHIPFIFSPPVWINLLTHLGKFNHLYKYLISKLFSEIIKDMQIILQFCYFFLEEILAMLKAEGLI